MRVIYFTYNQSKKYLRFYYLPSSHMDGIIVFKNQRSFVYFNTAQHNIQDTLRTIDKDIELYDCRFSYKFSEMLYFMHKPDATYVCKHTTRLLGRIHETNDVLGYNKKTTIAVGSRSLPVSRNTINTGLISEYLFMN